MSKLAAIACVPLALFAWVTFMLLFTKSPTDRPPIEGLRDWIQFIFILFFAPLSTANLAHQGFGINFKLVFVTCCLVVLALTAYGFARSSRLRRKFEDYLRTRAATTLTRVILFTAPPRHLGGAARFYKANQISPNRTQHICYLYQKYVEYLSSLKSTEGSACYFHA